jgi:4-amino-4-deoxychorismate lyase
MSSSTHFDLLTTIRYDEALLNNSTLHHGQPSPFLLLPYHFDRLKTATMSHGWQDTFTSISWASFQSSCYRAVQAYDGPAKGGPFKVRLLRLFRYQLLMPPSV